MQNYIEITINSAWTKVKDGKRAFGDKPNTNMNITLRFKDVKDAAKFQETLPWVIGGLLKKAKEHGADVIEEQD